MTPEQARQIVDILLERISVNDAEIVTSCHVMLTMRDGSIVNVYSVSQAGMLLWEELVKESQVNG